MPGVGYARLPSASLGEETSLAYTLSGIVLAAGIFSATYLTWRPGPILFTFSDMAFCIGFLWLAMARRLPMTPMGPLTPYWLGSSTCILVGLFLSSMIHGDPVRWLIAGLQYAFSLVVLPMLLIGHSAQRTDLCSKALLAGVVAMEALAIVLYLVFGGEYQQVQRVAEEFITGAGRVAAFMTDANANAAIMAMTLPFVYFYLFRAQTNRSKLIFLGALAVLYFALVLAASVTGLTASLLATVVFLIIGRVAIPPKFIAAVVGLALVFTVSGVTLPRAFQNRVAPALETGSLEQAGTFTGRWELIQEAWDIAERTMFLGLGADQYRVVSVDQAPVHNTYLLLWTEGGLLSLIGWIGLFVILAIGSASAIRHDKLNAALALGVLTSFLVFSMALPHMYARAWFVPLFLGVARAFVYTHGRSSRRLGR